MRDKDRDEKEILTRGNNENYRFTGRREKEIMHEMMWGEKREFVLLFWHFFPERDCKFNSRAESAKKQKQKASQFNRCGNLHSSLT